MCVRFDFSQQARAYPLFFLCLLGNEGTMRNVWNGAHFNMWSLASLFLISILEEHTIAFRESLLPYRRFDAHLYQPSKPFVLLVMLLLFVMKTKISPSNEECEWSTHAFHRILFGSCSDLVCGTTRGFQILVMPGIFMPLFPCHAFINSSVPFSSLDRPELSRTALARVLDCLNKDLP